MSDRLLVLVRHGQSEWNLKNLFTGWKDPDLTEQGIKEAKRRRPQAEGAGLQLRHRLHLGAEARAAHARPDAGRDRPDRPADQQRPGAERARLWRPLRPQQGRRAQEVGRGAGAIWRRSYDVPPPGGESLKDTLARTLPYYVQEILPCVLRGERVLVAAHGNSLRALIMVLEGLTPENPEARTRHRRADHLPPQRGCDGGVQARSGGVNDDSRRRLAAADLSGFPAEHRPLAGDAPVIAGQLAVLAEHAMAGHHERHRVFADRGAHRARGLRACRCCTRCPNRRPRGPSGSSAASATPAPRNRCRSAPRAAAGPARHSFLSKMRCASGAVLSDSPRHRSRSASAAACRPAPPAPRRDRRRQGRPARVVAINARCRTARGGSRSASVSPRRRSSIRRATSLHGSRTDRAAAPDRTARSRARHRARWRNRAAAPWRDRASAPA